MEIIKRPPIIPTILGLLLTLVSGYTLLFGTKYVLDVIVCCVIILPLNYVYWRCLLTPMTYTRNKETIILFKKKVTTPALKLQIISASEAINLSITADKRQEYIRGSSTDMTFQLIMGVIRSFAKQGLYHAAFPELLYFPEVQNKLKGLGYDLQDYSIDGKVYVSCKVIWG